MDGPKMGGAKPPLLFTPLQLRDITLPNRIVLAPLGQYSSKDGLAADWYLVHLGKFALGGMGVVMTEATAVEPIGRVGHWDLGIWSDEHVPGLKRITDFLRSERAVPAIQFAHSGRKGSKQRPWEGNSWLTEADARRGEQAWHLVAPSPLPVAEGLLPPHELTITEIRRIVRRFGEAAARAQAAGFDLIELHAGHGYLISSFLSPITNHRQDDYGRDRAGRMRLVLEIVAEMRRFWCPGKPIFCRISCVDGDPNGWTLEDSIVLAKNLEIAGVDVIDCSSGGLTASPTLTHSAMGPGYQVPYAAGIRKGSGVKTMAVGLIFDGVQAEAILQSGAADLIAIGREAMYDPFWARHAAHQLGFDMDFEQWPEQSGWWLRRRARALANANFRK
jgi:2,4-dienoyl-CoA reductase-like NADH-dependent reductase (Old Yellow Enzyme family)